MYICTMENKERDKKEPRISAKCVHVTLHNLNNNSKDYWLEKGMRFRNNVVACLVGIEENHEENKGLHAHIIMQFSTQQQMSRRQCVKHFGTDSIHIATKPNKNALVMALGYISKTGNTAQSGSFIYKGVPLEATPEVYRFKYRVKSITDGLEYFEEVIKEHISTKESIIERAGEKDNAIGRWLREHERHAKTLQKIEHTWKLKHRNAAKRGFAFKDWVDNKELMEEAYRGYLKAFKGIFEENREPDSDLMLEGDFDQYVSDDLEVLRRVIMHLKIAHEYGHKRPHKYLNLFLWSKAPSFGKTRLLDFINDNMVAYRLPNDQYYVDYHNFHYHVLVSDEAGAFLKTKVYSHLKLIFEGANVEFNRKKKTKVIKQDNPLIVLADNISFSELMKRKFHDDYSKEVFATRVLDLEIKSRATLHFLIDRCIIKGEFKQLKLDV